MKKVDAVALFSGYVETTSWGGVFLTHDKGFDTVENALLSINSASVDLAKYYKDQGAYKDARPEELVGMIIEEVMAGSMQEHPMFYDYLAEKGWDTSMQVDTPLKDVVVVSNADEVIHSIYGGWTDDKMDMGSYISCSEEQRVRNK